MRFINLSNINPNDAFVSKWLNEAQTHLAALSKLKTHDERKDYLGKHPHWNKLKKILKDLYGEKCWYSECSIEGDFGDVDHFRPKNESTDENGNVLLQDGYWWLAYDYNNYRMSCEKCNRPYGSEGKKERFPLKTGTVPAVNPNSKDDNILLDPCSSSDCDLIDCDDSGAIVPTSSNPDDIYRVGMSVKILNLQEFNTARKTVRLACKMNIERYERHYNNGNIAEFPDDFMSIQLLIKSDVPYSSFARKYILEKIVGKPYEQIIQKLIRNTP